jgi:hypothetical protein
MCFEDMDKCTWLKDHGEDCYYTTCFSSFVFIGGDVSSNELKYCPYCGKEIKESNCDNGNDEEVVSLC